MVDPALFISGAIGVAVAAGGGWVRQRYGARTAARLLYAELTRNTAPILYYRETGRWPTNPVVDAAWNEYGKDLARAGNADRFDTVYRGYAALPELGYVLQESAIGDADRRAALFDDAVDDVVAALETVAAIAKVERTKVDARVTRMRHQLNAAGALASGVTALQSEGVMPYAYLERVAVLGTPRERSAAKATISASPRVSVVSQYGPPDPLQAAVPGLIRRILDATGDRDLGAAQLVRKEGDPPTRDRAVDETYDRMGTTARFYREVYGRETLVESGGPLTAVVHYGQRFANCFWDGARLVVGDGDDQILHLPTTVDIIAHELSHGVMAGTNLVYKDQPGALLESLCDVFGVLAKQYTLNQKTASEANWLVGEGVLVRGTALRSLAAPGTAYDDSVFGKDPQPSHLSEYVGPTGHFQSPLINSGIPSHAFYLAATALPGPAWETAGRVWYDAAMSGRLRATSGFSAFAALTLAEARTRFGNDGPELAAIRTAWRKVGVRPRAPAPEAATASTGSG